MRPRCPLGRRGDGGLHDGRGPAHLRHRQRFLRPRAGVHVRQPLPAVAGRVGQAVVVQVDHVGRVQLHVVVEELAVADAGAPGPRDGLDHLDAAVPLDDAGAARRQLVRGELERRQLHHRAALPRRRRAAALRPEDDRAADGRPPPQLALVLPQLAEEADVGVDDGPAGLDVLVGLVERHAAVLHEVGDAEGGGARHAGAAVDHALLLGAGQVDRVDLVGHEVEVHVELGADAVLDGDLDGVGELVGHGGELEGGVDDAGDAQVEEDARGDGARRREVEVVRQRGRVVVVEGLAAVGHRDHHLEHLIVGWLVLDEADRGVLEVFERSLLFSWPTG